jgi:hypothetical protein
MQTLYKNPAVSLTPLTSVNGTAKIEFADFRSDYLGEYEAICETTFTR